MNTLKKYGFIGVFLLIIMGAGFLSQMNLIRYYVSDEIDTNEWTPDLGNKFETTIASTFYRKFTFININGAICNILNQPRMNGITKLNNGYLVTPLSYASDETLQGYADSISKFQDYLKEEEIPLLYASTPFNNSKYDPQLPIGITDYCNDDVDRFLGMLRKYNINTMDFREELNNDGLDQYDYMYKTDHHWTTQAGFYAYSKLEKSIVDKTGCTVDPRISDINEYTITTYKKSHLGSSGQRTGRYYAGIDDFDLIIPKFDTKLCNSTGETGRMQDLVINTEPLYTNDYSSRYTYDHVLEGAMDDYTNLDCCNNVKILMISDSYSRAVNPYLAMGFYQIKCIYNLEVSNITPSMIEEYDPDIVIMLYYPGCLFEGGGPFAFNEF